MKRKIKTVPVSGTDNLIPPESAKALRRTVISAPVLGREIVMKKTKQAAQHTPGPWTIQPIGDESECNILGAKRELIATVADNDANLISAAPDLLEAAKLASNNPLSYEKWMPQIIAAIRKAEGSL